MAPKKKDKGEEGERGGFLKAWQDRSKEQKDRMAKRFGEERTLMSGDPCVDWAQGGFKRGRANLFFGPSKSGKTTIACILAGMEQKKTKGKVIVFDSEFAHDQTDPETIERWESYGLDPDETIAISSNEVTDLFQDLGRIEVDIRKGELNVSAFVVDSWGGVQSEDSRKKIAAGKIAEAANQYGGNAKTINPILQTLLRICSKYGVTGFFVQHCIENMEKDQYGNPKGPKWILLGGQKLRYLCHGITFFETVEAKDALLGAGDRQINRDDDLIAIGKKIRMRCEKSRKQVEGRKVEFWMDFQGARFARPAQSLWGLATRLGVFTHPAVPELDKKGKPKLNDKGEQIVKVSTSWWQFDDNGTVIKFQVAEGTARLEEDKDFYQKVFNACLTTNRQDAVGAAVGSEEGIAGDGSNEDLSGIEIPGDDANG